MIEGWTSSIQIKDEESASEGEKEEPVLGKTIGRKEVD